MRPGALLAALALAGCAPAADSTSQSGAGPTIVSLNPCSDAVLAEIAGPGQLRAISAFSHDPASSSMDLALAKRFPATGGTVEEVLALHPDLVVADDFLPAVTAAALAGQGIRVERISIARSVHESLAQVRRLAALTGRPAAGEAMVAGIDAALAQAAPPKGTAPIAAVVWQSGGIVPGEQSLIGDLLRRTGFASLSAARGLGQADLLPLESMLADPPRVILAAGDPKSNEDRLLRHPALAALKGTRRERLDPRLLWCGGPGIAATAKRLAAIRERL